MSDMEKQQTTYRASVTTEREFFELTGCIDTVLSVGEGLVGIIHGSGTAFFSADRLRSVIFEEEAPPEPVECAKRDLGTVEITLGPHGRIFWDVEKDAVISTADFPAGLIYRNESGDFRFKVLHA